MAALNSLHADNLVTRQAAALELRLRALFPADKFDFQYLPAAPTQRVWNQVFRRLPAVALQFVGLTVAADSGRLPRVSAEWQMVVATQNPAGAGPRLLGDSMGPGLAGMVVVATLALQGLAVAGAGSATVDDVRALGAEFLDDQVAAAGLAFRFGPVQLIDADALGSLDEFLLHGPVWGLPNLDPALSPAPFTVRSA